MAEDAIFKLPTPILFAHRGGAREAPESTREAFEHAVEKARADILELDVQLTNDKEIIVWHGPNLDNVWIDGQSSSIRQRKRDNKRNIFDFRWSELKNRAWVLDPKDGTVEDIEEEEDVQKIRKRELMPLSDFLDEIKRFDTEKKKIPINIELKGEKQPGISDSIFLDNDIMQAFVDLLESKSGGRTILVASTRKRVLSKYIEMGGRFPVNVPMIKQLPYLAKMRPWYLKAVGWLLRILPSIRKGIDLEGRAFQTSHYLLSRSLVDEVHRANAAVHVFLTKFLFIKPLIKDKTMDEHLLKTALFKLLETGVDGIMTDYPVMVSKILNEWKSSR